MIPGANILKMALGLVAPQTVEWLRFTGRATNAAGIDVVTYAAPVSIAGSVQAVKVTLIQQLGLDMTKNYITFYASESFGDPDRDKTGDLLKYAGKVYRITSKTPWHAQDGWEYVLAVEVTNATE